MLELVMRALLMILVLASLGLWLASQQGHRTYLASDGSMVQSPTYAANILPGAVAVCFDGTQSFSRHTWGTCNFHGGVAHWLKPPRPEARSEP